MFRRSHFPLVVAAMTLALGAAIFLNFRDSATFSSSTDVTPATYRAAARGVLTGLNSELDSLASNQQKADLLMTRQEQLLELTVPAEYKDLHLRLVIILARWADEFEKDGEDRAAIEEKWRQLIDELRY